MKFRTYRNTKDCKPDAHAVWLQDIGWVAGIPASDCKPGMHLLYNGGSSQEVLRVELKGKSAIITTKSNLTGEWTQTRRGIIPCQFPSQ